MTREVGVRKAQDPDQQNTYEPDSQGMQPIDGRYQTQKGFRGPISSRFLSSQAYAGSPSAVDLEWVFQEYATVSPT